MNERDKWKLRGSVRLCVTKRTWYARKCGAEACEAEERGDSSEVELNEDGTLLRRFHVNPDKSQWLVTHEYEYGSAGQLKAVRQIQDSVVVGTSEYDDQGRLVRCVHHAGGVDRTTDEFSYDVGGRKTRTQYLPTGTTFLANVPDSETFYSAPGAQRLITFHNERDQPIEFQFYDGSGQLLSTVVFTYDADGHLIKESQTRSNGAFESLLLEVPEDQREAAGAMIQSITTPIEVEHQYDLDGHRVESRKRLGLLGDERTTRSFNEHGDEAEQVSEEHSREYQPDEDGEAASVVGSERASRSETRFRYQYDERGNWVSKSVEGRSGAEDVFAVSSVETRRIEYFG